MLLGQEIADGDADDGRAPLPAAHDDLEADLARGIAVHAKADVMHLHRGPVMRRAGDPDLELARQEGKFRMKCRPLPDDLAPDPRVFDLVGRDPGEVIGRDIANAVAAGLDGMHLHLGQLRQDVRRVGELDPVELDVLARGEMAVAAVVAPGDVGELAKLRRIERAVGNGDPQHIGVELQVEPIHQPKGLELLLADLAREPARHLLPELLDPLLDQGPVVAVIGIHR